MYAIYYAAEYDVVRLHAGQAPVPVEVGKTHRFVMTLAPAPLETIYTCLQGENWSPHGEARGLIRAAGVHHTSMSVGDLIADGLRGRRWLVTPAGFQEM